MSHSCCRSCLLPSAAPGAALDPNRLCAPCRDYPRRDRSGEEEEREARVADLERALGDCRGKGDYDCLVCFSGGRFWLSSGLLQPIRDALLKGWLKGHLCRGTQPIGVLFNRL